MRYAVFITGPAGAGKSTFCTSFSTHLQLSRRTAHIVNLDPAATGDAFEYEPAIDIRQLVTLEDVMTEMGMGPNGGLVYCFEYLLENMDWLEEELGGFDDDYLIIDCPGQIELYTHHPFLPSLARNLQRMGIRTCAVYLLESQFMEDRYKFFSGVLSAMSAMVNLEIPWINIMSKMDLVSPSPSSASDTTQPRNGRRARRDIARYLDPDPLLLANARDGHDRIPERENSRFHELNRAIVQLIEDHPLVSFLPLDLTSTDSLEVVVSHIDFTMQYGEDEEPREPRDLDEGDFADMDRIMSDFLVGSCKCNMTIYGIGVDLLHVPRMAKLINRRGLNKIASRILSPSERSAFCQDNLNGTATRFLGVRWAVKEAAYKALCPLRPTWKELTYTTFDPQTGSKPALIFHPNRGDIPDQRPRLHVSVSHDGEYIFAYVVAEDMA